MASTEIENAQSAQRRAQRKAGYSDRPTPNHRGFTLIELLVVISILVFLIALLLPALGRARNQSRAVVCQAKLRQWGIVFAAYTNDYDGRFYPWSPWPIRAGSNLGAWQWPYALRRYYRDGNDLLLCPAASRKPAGDASGTTDLAATWCSSVMLPPKDLSCWYFGSYGLNGWIGYLPSDPTGESSRGMWGGRLVPNGGNVPVLIDSLSPFQHYSVGEEEWTPPAYEGEPPADTKRVVYSTMNYACLDRHSGGVNALFMDWSARKVGVKELWVLKWHKEYNTAGYWTKAGGRTPEDWPPWMRRFKDY
jgi:prepilin-type N-terminal cleavage/methylation domain-containing protein/prepilin-type processing-associated H-X9-DG protein